MRRMVSALVRRSPIVGLSCAIVIFMVVFGEVLGEVFGGVFRGVLNKY